MFLLVVSLFIASASPQESGFRKWHSVPRAPYGSKASLYQRRLYGYNNGLKTTRLHNETGDRRDVPWIPYALKTTGYKVPFYESNQNVKHLQTFSKSPFQNTFGVKSNVPQVLYVRKRIHHQRPSHALDHFKLAFAPRLEPQNAVEKRRKLSWTRYAPKINSHQRPFREVKQIFLEPRLQSPGNGRKSHLIQYAPKANSYQRPFHGADHNFKQKFSVPPLPNGIGKRRNFSWIPQLPKTLSYNYQRPSHVPNSEVERATILEPPTKMTIGMVNTQYGRSTTPHISPWMSDVQRNREIRKSGFPAFAPSSISIEPRLTSNYQLQQQVMRRKLEPVTSNADVYNIGNVALQNVLSQLSQSGDHLIPESASNQHSTTRTGDITDAMEEEQRPVPRKSYVAKSLMAKESRLNDMQLIKLGKVLQSLKKRSVRQVDSGASGKHFVFYALHPDVRRRLERSSTSSGNRILSTNERNSENSVGKKSSIRKMKGRQKWGFFNEFSPNVRLASMILLKQNRQKIRKRGTKDPLETFEKFASGEKGKAKRKAKQSLEIPDHNRVAQNIPVKRQNGKGMSLSSVNDVKSLKKHKLTFEGRKMKNQSAPKRRKIQNTRNLIEERSKGFYVDPKRAYLNSQFSPFGGIVPGQRKYLTPFSNSIGQSHEGQMKMEERVRATMFGGLFQTMDNRLEFNRAPFRYFAMPMSQQFAMQGYGLPFQYGMHFPQTRSNFVPAWNMGFSNGIREQPEFDFEPPQQKGSGNLATSNQDAYDQQTGQAKTEEGKSPGITSQLNRDQFNGNYLSPFAEESSQVHKIDDNKAFEGLPKVNTAYTDTSNGDLNVNKNSQLTGMQVSDQSSTMLNRWYPVRGKVSFMSDPRKVSYQWLSRLPGLEQAAVFNKLQTRGYFPAMYGPFSSRFYQDTEDDDGGRGPNNFAGDENDIESEAVGFNRGYMSPLRPYVPLRHGEDDDDMSPFSRHFTEQDFGSVQGMNGISGEEKIPYSGEMDWYSNTPDGTLPYKVQRQELQKRDILQRANKSSKVPQKKHHLVNGSVLNQGLEGSHKSVKTNLTSPDAPDRNNSAVVKIKKLEKIPAHLRGTNIRQNRTFVNMHFSNIRKKKRERKPRNFVNMGTDAINPAMSPNLPLFTPFYTPTNQERNLPYHFPSVPTNDPRAHLMAFQIEMEDPISVIERKGYSIQNRISGLADISRTWPFQYSSNRPEQQSNQFQELAFPDEPPQSLMELSQKVDQFPRKAPFPSEEVAQRQAAYAESMPTFQSNVNEDHDQSSESQAREFQPKTVSAALNLFPSHQSLTYFPEQPLLHNEPNYPTDEQKTEQNEPEPMASPPSYSPGDSDLSENVPDPSDGGVSEFPKQSTQEFPEEGFQSMPENSLHEKVEDNGQGLTDGREGYSEDSQIDYSPGDDASDVPGESDSNFSPGLLDGLDNSQASLLKQQIGGLAMKGINEPLPANRPELSERRESPLQESALAKQKALFQPRSMFSTKGNIQERTRAGRKDHRLSLPNLSLNSVEKLIDSASEGSTKAVFSMDAIQGDGVSSKGPLDRTTDGKYVHSFNWKSPLIGHSQSPSDFNWKLENLLSQWNDRANQDHDTANAGGRLSDNPPENVLVHPKGSTNNPDVVPGFTFDTQGQRSGPLFLPNPPPELGEDSNAETVLMVPPLANKSGVKKEKVEKKKSRKKIHKKSEE